MSGTVSLTKRSSVSTTTSLLRTHLSASWEHSSTSTEVWRKSLTTCLATMAESPTQWNPTTLLPTSDSTRQTSRSRSTSLTWRRLQVYSRLSSRTMICRKERPTSLRTTSSLTFTAFKDVPIQHVETRSSNSHSWATLMTSWRPRIQVQSSMEAASQCLLQTFNLRFGCKPTSARRSKTLLEEPSMLQGKTCQ